MKKYICVCVAVYVISSCETVTYEDVQPSFVITGTVTYNVHVKNIISTYCLNCHSMGGVASFRPLTTYDEVKDAIQSTNLLDRIQRQNGESGQMPQTGRMPQDKINTIIQWNSDGLVE